MRIKSFRDYLSEQNQINEDVFNTTQYTHVIRLHEHISKWVENFYSYDKFSWGSAKEILKSIFVTKNIDNYRGGYPRDNHLRITEDGVVLMLYDEYTDDDSAKVNAGDNSYFIVSFDKVDSNSIFSVFRTNEKEPLKIVFFTKESFREFGSFSIDKNIIGIYGNVIRNIDTNNMKLDYDNSTLTHEVLHYLDKIRYPNKEIMKSQGYLYKDQNKLSLSDYINNPVEYFANSGAAFIAALRSLMMDPKEKFTFKNFKKAVLSIFPDNTYNALGNKYLKKFNKQLYKTYQKVKENYEAYKLISYYTYGKRSDLRKAQEIPINDYIIYKGLNQMISTDNDELQHWLADHKDIIIEDIEYRLNNNGFFVRNADIDINQKMKKVLHKLKNL